MKLGRLALGWIVTSGHPGQPVQKFIAGTAVIGFTMLIIEPAHHTVAIVSGGHQLALPRLTAARGLETKGQSTSYVTASRGRRTL